MVNPEVLTTLFCFVICLPFKSSIYKIYFAFVGGLLVCMAPSDAVEYCNELENIDRNKAWIIGEVIQGEREAKLSENFEIIEV